MTGSSAPGRVSPREVAELVAWCRRLSMAGPDTDPAQRAAYLAAKTDLLARISDHPDNDPGRRGHRNPEEQR